MSATRLPGFARLLLGGWILLAAMLLSAPAGARWIDLGGGPVEVRLVDSDGDRNTVEITVGGFEATPVTIEGDIYYRISVEGATVQETPGFPALPDVRRGLIIPDEQDVAVRLIDSDYVDLPAMPVAPSKGHLPRTIDPETVPYSFGSFYQTDGIYPEFTVRGEAPHILRDLRGTVLDANAFQYMPATRTLRVYTRMLIEVAPSGPATLNPLHRNAPLRSIDPQFAQLYEHHFLNFEGGKRYTPVLEDGGLLIITYDAFRSAVEPLYHWKLQKGIPTKLVNLSEIGSTSAQIDAYIQAEYNATGISYVLLVGDAQQIPTISYGGGSDPSYCLITADDYPDLFIGRFSAETLAHVTTQVERTLYYERDITTTPRWEQSGTGIASSQGSGIGHYGESDIVHENQIRDQLLGYGYDQVDQLYDPGATASQVAAALNAGRGIVNYTGHGSTTSWSTTGFSNSHVTALSNDNMLPFICSVACLNGDFTSTTCFAEAWLRATHNGFPTGAIGAYMSTISQSWAPPMDTQDEAVDLMTAESMHTLGGLWFNGSCLMIDNNGSTGVNEFKCWTIFGDPSLAVRTKQAALMTVNHAGALILGQTTYDVTVPGVHGALCALYANDVLYGTAYTDGAGFATITMAQPPLEPMTLLLTVTAYNKETAIEDVQVVPASGPYLLVNAVQYLDGNGDGILNAGEAVQMNVELENVGSATAANVSAQLSSESEHVALSVDTQTYPDLLPAATEWSDGPYAFDIAADCPDGYTVSMPITMNADERLTWLGTINFIVAAPTITVASVLVDDTSGGNSNLRLDPGESAFISITLANSGSYTLNDVIGVLACAHPQVTVSGDSASSAGIASGETGMLDPVYFIEIDPDYPLTEGIFTLEVTGANGYSKLFEVRLPIGGFYEPVESGAPGWAHAIVLPGYGDQWHISTERNHTPYGGASWKCGDAGTGSYANLLDAGLTTPEFELAADSGELRFWQWIDSEESSAYAGRAYDGGLVEISIDGGAFTQITPVGGYTHTIRAGSQPGPLAEGTPVFAGTFDWHQVVFDLSAYSGTCVIRWRFGSDGAVTREGWHIDDVEILGAGDASDVTPPDRMTTQLSLAPCRPNPSGGMTQIAFTLPADGKVSLQVFDAAGRLVRTLANEPLAAGQHSLVWRGDTELGTPAASGIYYYRLSTPSGMLNRSLVLMR
jgi:hypothetical protein